MTAAFVMVAGAAAAATPTRSAHAHLTMSASARAGAKIVTTMELKGTYYEHFGDRDAQNYCGYTTTYKFEYDEVAVATGADLDNNERPDWHFKKLTGVSKKEPDASPACAQFPNLDPPCSAPISLRPGWVGSNSDVANVYRIQQVNGKYEYTVAGYVPLFGLTTESSCGDVKGRYSNPNGNDGGAYVVRNANVPAGHTVSTHKGENVNTTSPTGDGSGTHFEQRHAHATLTVAAEQPGEQPPSIDHKARAARDAAKIAARADLDPAFNNAKGPCLNYALGLGLFGSGTLLAGTPVVGPTFTLAGSLTALAAEPFCVATLTRIGTDLRIYHDPPDPHIHRLAPVVAVHTKKLPKCDQADPDVKAFCVALEAALTKWDTAGAHVRAADRALSTTINRLSTAIKHHKKSGEKAQAKHATSLVSQVHKARKALASAGSALATVYRNDGLSMPVSHKRATQAIHFMLGKLKHQHISAKTVKSVSSKALMTKAYDGLAALSAG